MKHKTERVLIFNYPFECQREMENLKMVLTENNIEFICYESNGYYPHQFVVRKSEKKWNDIYHLINYEDVIIRQTVDAVMENLECLLDDCSRGVCTAYPLSNRHNVYAEVTGDASEMWIDIKLEIYDSDGDWVGDLTVVDTKDMSRESLEQAITEIVKYYYGEV